MGIENLSTLWPDWKIVDKIGEGSYGKVYKVIRENHGITSCAAVKIISVPQSEAEIDSLRSDGLSASETRTYFEDIVMDFINEIKLLEALKGTSNIVSIDDYGVLEKPDAIGWDIFIRMELLTPLHDHIADRKLTEAEVIRLGQDICCALELCARQNIIHRDIKPENIFVSPFGDFKVGDFGVARELEKTRSTLSQKGTYGYMAPEVMTSKQYDATVDTCSLGLVLYKLLNNNRLPFLDTKAPNIRYQDRKDAIDRRLGGEPLPPPPEAGPEMARIILKACAFNPADRYPTPAEFRNALAAVNQDPVNQAPVNRVLDKDYTEAVRRAPETTEQQPAPGQRQNNRRKPLIAAGIALSVVLLLALALIIAVSSPNVQPAPLQGAAQNKTAQGPAQNPTMPCQEQDLPDSQGIDNDSSLDNSGDNSGATSGSDPGAASHSGTDSTPETDPKTDPNPDNSTTPTPGQYKVTYNYTENGGTSVTKATETATAGKAVDLSPQAGKNGWRFVGWNTDKNATSALSSHTMPTSNLTLYAIYEKTLTATFKDYSTTTLTSRIASVTIYNKAAGGTITVPVQNTYSGWESRGWGTATAANAGVTIKSGSYTISADTTFYGLYQRTLTLTYARGSSSQYDNVPLPAAANGTEYANSYDIKTRNSPTVTLATGFGLWREDLTYRCYNPGESYTLTYSTTMFIVF